MISFNSGKVYAKDDDMYETSDGTKFRFDDIVIYQEEFVDVAFETTAEFVDYVYTVGYNRTSTCDGTYTINGNKVTKAEFDLAKEPRF